MTAVATTTPGIWTSGSRGVPFNGRYRLSPRQLRRFARSLAAGKRPIANLRVEAVDADGNLTAVERAIRVTR